MEISPLVPVAGIVLIVANVLVAVISPYTPPKLMGLELFIAGMITILISVLDLINPIGISALERALLFIAGCVNCSAGYYMVLLELRRE